MLCSLVLLASLVALASAQEAGEHAQDLKRTVLQQ
jgi:hypothetical protein